MQRRNANLELSWSHLEPKGMTTASLRLIIKRLTCHSLSSYHQTMYSGLNLCSLINSRQDIYLANCYRSVLGLVQGVYLGSDT